MAKCRRQAQISFAPILLILMWLVPLSSATADDPLVNTVTVVIPGNFPPHYLVDKDGNADGFAVDTMNAVAGLAGLNIQYRVKNNWFQARLALERGDVDIIPNMGVTSARKSIYDFTLPLETFPLALFVRTSNPNIHGLADLEGKRVAVIKSNAGITYLKQHPGIETIVFESIGTGLFALLSSEVDGLIYPAPWTLKAASDAGIDDRIMLAGGPLKEIVRAMAIHKGNTALREKLDTAIEKFRDSPDYSAIYTKWFGKPKSFWTLQRFIWFLVAVVGIVFLLIVFVVVWRNRSLRSINDALTKTIEERRQAEISLNDQILRNELILQTAHEGFTVMDMQGNFRDANPAYCELMGYSYHELMSMTLFEVRVSVPSEELKQKMVTVAEAGSARFDTQHRTKDGRILDLDVSITLGEMNNNRFYFAFYRDVTEQKRAQAELLKSEQLWRTVVENVPDFIAMINRDGVIQFVNREMPQYPPGRMIGSTVFDYQSDARSRLTREKLAHVFEVGETVSFETIDDDASDEDHKHSYITRIAPIFSGDQVTSALMLSVDVTELRQIEQALRSSEELLLSVTRHSPDYILMLDRDGKIRFINRAVADKPVAEMIGKLFLDFVPAQNRVYVRAALDRVAKTGEQDTFYSEIFTHNGTGDYYESNIGPIKKDNEVTAFTVSARNITDRKRIEIAMQAMARGADKFDFNDFIRDAVRLLAHVYNVKFAFVGLISQPLRTQVNTLAVWSGDHFAENFVYDLQGTPCKDILEQVIDIVPDNAASLYSDDELMKTLNVKSYFGAPLFSPSGETIGVLSVMDEKPMTFDASLKNILGVFATRISVEIDRTRSYEEVNHYRGHLEELVSQRTKELEQVNQELESFCYSVSHDLRAPLRTIDGFSQIVLEDYNDVLDTEGVSYLERVRKATQRMGDLIDDMLSLYSVTRGDIKTSNINMTALAQEVIENIKIREPAHKVELVVQDNLKAVGDERLVKIALENLINNAWKFSGKSEHPRIEVGRVNNSKNATYFVRDNGVGFDMAYVNKLFGAFKRLHHEFEFEGTGIGLAIVKRIIERHQGRVWAEGEPGSGATFFFTLN